MRKSKLEACEEILKVLTKEASTVDRLSYEADMDCNIVKDSLRFMIKNGLVEERRLNKTTTLNVITDRGVGVLRALNFQKYLVKVKATVSTLDEAM
jgi:predicted transcriptional regulator